MKQEGKHCGIKNSHYGKCWITKNNKSIVIDKNLLAQYIEDGWIKGRKIKNKENIVKANKNKSWINKDGQIKFIYTSDLEQYLNDGWKRGKQEKSPTYTQKEKKQHYNPFVGKVLVEIDGKRQFIQKNDPRLKTGELTPYGRGRVAAIDKDGNSFYVKTNDPRYLSGELKPKNQSLKNKVLCHDENFNYIIVNKDDERLKSGELLMSTTGLKYSDETRKNMRLNIKKYINSCDGNLKCRYSKKGCQFMNELNKQNDWNLQHAEHGGEFEIDGYYLDGYDKNLNIAFEYDEPKHYQDIVNNVLKEKDQYRQNYIINKLHCEFWRYNEKTKSLYRVN